MPSVIIPPTDVSPNTGSGSEVLSTSPTIVTPTINTINSAAATNMTLNAGSSGATLVLGQGAGGIATLNRNLTVSGAVTANDFILGSGGASLTSTMNARAPRQGLVFDGSSQATVSNGRAIGTGDFTVGAWVKRPGSSLAVPIWGGSGSIGVAVRATTITLDRPVLSGTVATWTYTVPSDKSVFVAIKRSGTTATAYVDGVSIGDVTGINTDFSGVFSIVGLTSFSIGSVFGPYIYNRALSAAEVLALYESGVPARLDYGLATNDSSAIVYAGQQIINGANSTFSSGAGWTLEVGNSISGGKLNLINLAYALCNNTNLRKGIGYRLTITIDSISAGTLRVYDGVNYTGVIGNTTGTKTLDYTMAADAPVFMRMEGGTAVVDDITITPLGLLVAPDAAQPGGGLAWYDTSGNSATITLPASGVSWNVVTSGKINAPLMVGGVDGGAKLNVYTPTTAEVGYLYGIRLSDESTSTLAFGLQTPTGTVRPFIHGNVGLGFGAGGVAAVNITSGQQVQVLATTASTTTSSGALVVSGGIGVAGAINGGGLFDFAVSANSTQVYTIQNTSTGASASTRLTLVGGTSSGSIQLYGSGHSTPNILQYASPDTHKWQCNGVERASLSSAGNLTVGGTLTVNGAGSSAFAGGIASTKSINSPFEGLLLTNSNAGAAAAVYDAKSNGTNLLVSLLTGTGASGAFLGGGPSGVSANIYTTAADIPVVLGTNGAARLWVNATGTTISSTTASTSTSTGALVVSGGVGVAGAAFFGGNATVFGAAGITINNVGGAGNDSILTLTQSGVSSAFIKNTATTGDIAIGDGGGTYLRITKGAGVVFVPNTTASTTTSSGALVVSGGVGVAGAIYAGGGLTVTGGSAAAGSIFKTSTLGLVMSGATGSSYDLFVTNPAGNYIMQVPTGTRNVEFASTLTTIGNITSGAAILTSAPAGGSGAWELGVYSTTAPAATGYVTIEIAGVAYKLLASNV